MDEEFMIASKNFDKLPDICKAMFFESLYGNTKYQEFFGESALLVYRASEFDYSYCKSPIEVIFNFAFDLVRVSMNDVDDELRYLRIESQHEIEIKGKTYIADFMIYQYEKMGNDYKLLIECDGHDYHSTKEQIAKDHERQYAIEDAGYDVLRFSGSEIYKDPVYCVAKALKRFKKKSRELKKIKIAEGVMDNV